MARNVRVEGVRKKQVDEDKIALAFLLLARAICEGKTSTASDESVKEPGDKEAA